MSTIKTLQDYPDISFIGGYTLEQLYTDMLAWFLEKRKEVTGQTVVLGEADDRLLLLRAAAYYLYHGYQLVDFAGKMNMLKYSIGNYLDNLGANVQLERKTAAGSTVLMEYSMNNARLSATGIPAGSRVTAGDGVYFATDEYAEIPAGDTSVTVMATCMTPGVSGNGYPIGDIDKMMDIVPYIDAVSNLTISEGGRDDESDDDYRERIFLAADRYTDAGSKGGYEYYVREFDPDIADVQATSPSLRNVVIRVLLADGQLPGAAYITALTAYLNNTEVRKLTDTLTVLAPTESHYDVTLTYYINESDKSKAISIQTAVTQAVNDYVLWQRSRIGLDINPDELISRIKAAGAKRVALTDPSYTMVSSSNVAVCDTVTVTYGGLEDD